MNIASIRALRPNVTQDEALRAFSAAGFPAVYWRMRSGPLRRIAEAYVPYSLYRVSYNLGRTAHSSLFAIDAVNGSLDLFVFPRISDDQLITVQTRNRLASSLERQQSETLLREKVLRAIFQQGFFKVRELNLEIISEPTELHIPYWLALYGNRVVRCRVLDAVRRRIEGSKASHFFEQWLAA